MIKAIGYLHTRLV